MFILGETINGENPATSSEIESTPKVEPKTVSDLPIAAVSLFHTGRASPLSLMRPNE